MDLRHKVNDELYETTISKRKREIRVGKPRITTRYNGAINYNWPEETTYESLDVSTITASLLRADIINVAKMNGKLLSKQEIAEQENPQINWEQEEQVEVPKIKSERNCWNVVLTEEEKNLISEFLEV